MLDVEPLPFDEAREFWKGKVVLSPEQFTALERAARVRAFTVSGIAKLDSLQDVFEAIGRAIEEGTTVSEFKKDIKDLIERKGWTGKRAWRIENIFRTNVQTSYQVGRYRQMTMPELLKRRPYWKYDAINDSQTRPTHLAMDGKVFPADSPIWDTWYPPNGYQCRCGVLSMSASDLRRQGLKVETEDPTGKLFELHASPNCGTWSPFALLNGSTRTLDLPQGDGTMESEEEGNKLAAIALWLICMCVVYGVFFTLESPSLSVVALTIGTVPPDVAWHLPH